jgi:hypothetical protein
MKRVRFAFYLLVLLIGVLVVQKGNITVSAALIQGDLVLTDNDVYVIEGIFDINGSIIVEENATLILKNAIVTFTQTADRQFNLTLQNPANGNPRLLVENTTLNANGYDLYVGFYANSTGLIDTLNGEAFKIWLRTFDTSHVSVSNSYFPYISVFSNSALNMSDSSSYATHIYEDSSFAARNCTIGILTGRDNANLYINNCSIVSYITVYTSSANCSIVGLAPGYFDYWNFKLNCSVTVAVGGGAPNFMLIDTNVNMWSFNFQDNTNATISNSVLFLVDIYDYAVASAYNTVATYAVRTWHNSKLYAYNSSTDDAYSYGNSEQWVIYSVCNYSEIHDQSRTYICWYLDAHVVDMNSDDVPYANVTVNYQNGTVTDSHFADAAGWAKFVLVQMMANATGAYPYGNYTVKATYASHSANTTVDMTENKQVTLMLEDFVIPEFSQFFIMSLLIITTLLAMVYKRKCLFYIKN